MLADQPPEVQRAVSQMFPRWPESIMIGTQPQGGYQLIYAAVTIPGLDPLGQVNELLNAFKLDWLVMGLQSFHNETVIKVGEDENGIPLYEHQPVVYLPLAKDTFDYVINDVDEDGKTIPVTEEDLSKFNGQAPWVMEAD